MSEEIERLREGNKRQQAEIERLNERGDKRLTSFDLLFEMQEAWKQNTEKNQVEKEVGDE